MGIERELGFKTRAAPATVSGVPSIEDHWIDRIREGDAEGPSRKPGDLLAVVVHRTAGARCASGNSRETTELGRVRTRARDAVPAFGGLLASP